MPAEKIARSLEMINPDFIVHAFGGTEGTGDSVKYYTICEMHNGKFLYIDDVKGFPIIGQLHKLKGEQWLTTNNKVR